MLDARIAGPDGIGRYTRNLTQALGKLMHQEENTLELISRNYDLQETCNHCSIDNSTHYSQDELKNKELFLYSRKPDIFHCMDYRVPFNSFGIPVVVTIHDIFRYTDPGLCYDDNVFIEKYGQSNFNDAREIINILSKKLNIQNTQKTLESNSVHFQYYSRMLAWAIESATAIITPTQVVKDEITKYFERSGNIFPVWHGINHLDHIRNAVSMSPNLDLPTKYILYVGQYRSHKNVDQVILSFKKASALLVDLHLVLAGTDFTNNTKLVTMLKSLGIENKVHVYGQISYDNLKTIYTNAMALVHLARLEGFGLPPLEALSCGTAVIAANNPTLKEVLQKHAVYVNYNDTNSVAKAIVEQSKNTDHNRAEKIEYAKRFTWEKAAKKVLEIYKNILN